MSLKPQDFVLVIEYILPWPKKEPSSRFAARRTLFHVWYHARSGAISAGQVRSATVRDFCPALIAPDRAWYHTWNSVLLAANLEDGSFFVQGSSLRASVRWQLWVDIMAIMGWHHGNYGLTSWRSNAANFLCLLKSLFLTRFKSFEI